MDPKLCLLVLLIITALMEHQVDADYIWHNDEIPYDAKAKCKRSHSYYTNNVAANDTDIDVSSDVESLLDYTDKDICYYCVCDVSGHHVGCLSRQLWFCEYYRLIRQEGAARDRYAKLFQQDRPTYFRQLSWRMRRTMDDGMYDFLQTVGGEDLQIESKKCIPFVSEYTDCSEENRCTGCNKCICVGDNKWSCQPTTECQDEPEFVTEISFDQALNSIQNELRQEDQAPSLKTYVPMPASLGPSEDKDLLLEFGKDGKLDIDQRIQAMMRAKRSVEDQNNHTADVKSHNTVDKLDEETVIIGNVSGTLQAQKVELLATPKLASRRTGLLTYDNLSKSSLQIEYNQPKVYDHHITDNRIDAAVHNDDKYDVMIQDKISKIIGNHTQKQKDRNLSKLVVNELKPGTEVIGDKNSPITSNITFTSDNDTLTAMAFIAGNLLNKLWYIEKDSGEDSKEVEALKHEKIVDLLDLFREPLNLRQENFLKNALEQLSDAVDKDKTLQNISICDQINETTKNILGENSINKNNEAIPKTYRNCSKENRTLTNEEAKEKPINTETISKINNILSLISKFQDIHKNLNNMKKLNLGSDDTFIKKSQGRSKSLDDSNVKQDDSEPLNIFGNIIEKIIKLLLPPKKSKKISKSIKNYNILKNTQDDTESLKDTYGVVNRNLTVKDKVVIDYLNTIKENPKCLLENLQEAKSISRVEGDILLNLSEFFKVKSFIDLINLIDPQRKTIARTPDTATIRSEIFTKIATTVTSTIKPTSESSNTLEQSKRKLKNHLRNIIDDLIDIQKAKGLTPKNITIADALPCIFKLLNNNDIQDKQISKETPLSKADKVAAIFNSLKKDLDAMPRRRSGATIIPRPKSAVVWERVISHLNGKENQQTRRMLEGDPKIYDELKKQIDLMKFGSKMYKNQVLAEGVPPSERLTLLKTLLEETKRSMNVLDNINTSLHNLKDESKDKNRELKDFVDNAATNIDLNKEVIKNINKVVVNRANKTVREGTDPVQKRFMKIVDVTAPKDRNNIKLTRDDIINQLIRNRMQLYIKIKESKGTDLSEDLNYDIAKRILIYLDSGNYMLARELYKILISQKQKSTGTTVNKVKITPVQKKAIVLSKEPVVKFDELENNRAQWLQGAWLKQLVNLKNMKV